MAQAKKMERTTKREKAYSRAGEGDDERVADQWNEKWVKKFWRDFLEELERGKK